MKIKLIQPNTNTPDAYLKAVAENAGCRSEKEIMEFLSPNPPILNTITELPDYIKAADRLKKAIGDRESIVIHGDYDCDGITALVQMLDALRAAGHDNVAWFIPNRMTNGYGLTQSGLSSCVAEHNPGLLIIVDCGSNSMNEINWLKKMGIESIVIDHHEVAPGVKSYPVAHLNPKACKAKNPSTERLTNMSASGLTFLFCEQFANSGSARNWDRNRALLLAGIGTLVDVMPLIGLNRALVKHSLRLANDKNELIRVPGLVALKKVSGTDKVKPYTYGFQWGPRLNALGRLEEATTSVELLLSETLDEAEPLADKCNRVNRERQDIQERMLKEAYEEASVLMEARRHKILILTGKKWHRGIVGIIASKIRDTFNRPTIVCGWDDENEIWTGSGRSIEGFDLGGAVNSAMNEGILLRGGGHKMACGLSFKDNRLGELRNRMDDECLLTKEDFIPSYTVLGPALSQDEETWTSIYERLEPFGNGNPAPYLHIRRGRLMWSGEKRTRDGRIWGISGGFRCEGGPDKLLYFTWTEVEKARAEWIKGNDYQIILRVRKSVVKAADSEPKIYHDWFVENCEPVSRSVTPEKLARPMV